LREEFSEIGEFLVVRGLRFFFLEILFLEHEKRTTKNPQPLGSTISNGVTMVTVANRDGDRSGIKLLSNIFEIWHHFFFFSINSLQDNLNNNDEFK
jgi:hypothetical protein